MLKQSFHLFIFFCGIAISQEIPAQIQSNPFVIVGNHDVSSPSSGLTQDEISTATVNIIPFYQLPSHAQSNIVDHALQKAAPLRPTPSPTPSVKFPGISYTGWIPPDPNIAVGPNHILEWVNTQIAVFPKAGGPPVYSKTMTELWSTFNGNCALLNNRNVVNGDGIVEYDQIADRWVIAQMVINTTRNTNNPINAECILVSKTNDPSAGQWYRYEFDFISKNGFIDYPKLAVWPDAYYFSANRFGTTFLGSVVCAFDRTNMLLGNAATAQCFNQSGAAGLPADLLGSNLPPSNSPAYFLKIATNSSLNLQKFHVDWTNPNNTALSNPITISVAPFTNACNAGTCIPQPATKQKLDSLGDRLMFRLGYRHFSDHESLVANHSVATSKPGQQSGIRWYEIQNLNDPNGTLPTVYQQGTYAGTAPNDTTSRWMGGIAIDKYGNIGLGYSASSSTLFPSIYAVGHSAALDPLGVMGQAESVLQAGGGSQTRISRWGDYSSMSVDPTDDCTFWYVNEHFPTTAGYSWATSIGSFKIPPCSP